jgi:DNA-binding PadR family transcriptional regulator
MTDALPSGKRLRILQLLKQHGSSTGAELIEYDPELPRGTIYTTLKRLQDDGFVKSKTLDDEALPGPPRRKYEVTALGARAVSAGELAEAVLRGRPIRLAGGKT